VCGGGGGAARVWINNLYHKVHPKPWQPINFLYLDGLENADPRALL
jgi:hypothetical protein